MNLARMFSYEKFKGTKHYINTQRKYIAARTALYFLISFLLFLTGYLTTGNRLNLLTVVAILGCLPASKSAVEMIMFFRTKSCSDVIADRIDKELGNLNGIFDLFFTSYSKNYFVSHLVVKGNTICGFTEASDFSEQDFYRHLGDILKAENYKDVNIKIFFSLDKYLERLNQLNELKTEEKYTSSILDTIKSVTL